ncbi:hypothetical protein SpCBS45565_g05921 [Spizellomyces sp. 'palustris']|nr:hypothetical protein SpCBS45565_g05921 [Spizellomyces sp. 'palustris']
MTNPWQLPPPTRASFHNIWTWGDGTARRRKTEAVIVPAYSAEDAEEDDDDDQQDTEKERDDNPDDAPLLIPRVKGHGIGGGGGAGLYRPLRFSGEVSAKGTTSSTQVDQNGESSDEEDDDPWIRNIAKSTNQIGLVPKTMWTSKTVSQSTPMIRKPRAFKARLPESVAQEADAAATDNNLSASSDNSLSSDPAVFSTIKFGLARADGSGENDTERRAQRNEEQSYISSDSVGLDYEDGAEYRAETQRQYDISNSSSNYHAISEQGEYAAHTIESHDEEGPAEGGSSVSLSKASSSGQTQGLRTVTGLGNEEHASYSTLPTLEPPSSPLASYSSDVKDAGIGNDVEELCSAKRLSSALSTSEYDTSATNTDTGFTTEMWEGHRGEAEKSCGRGPLLSNGTKYDTPISENDIPASITDTECANEPHGWRRGESASFSSLTSSGLLPATEHSIPTSTPCNRAARQGDTSSPLYTRPTSTSPSEQSALADRDPSYTEVSPSKHDIQNSTIETQDTRRPVPWTPFDSHRRLPSRPHTQQTILPILNLTHNSSPLIYPHHLLLTSSSPSLDYLPPLPDPHEHVQPKRTTKPPAKPPELHTMVLEAPKWTRRPTGRPQTTPSVVAKKTKVRPHTTSGVHMDVNNLVVGCGTLDCKLSVKKPTTPSRVLKKVVLTCLHPEEEEVLEKGWRWVLPDIGGRSGVVGFRL